MKEKIKEILREQVKKNSLNIPVTRDNQKLIIMRGIPGAGKSTKAKSLVGEGVIHSTDEVIESLGNYREFFDKMAKEKNFIPLMKAHGTNLKNAIKSMAEGISPVIIDNTNIKANEAKKYVVAALNMGYDDDNISIVDIGANGLEAEVLAERNAHGVPLEKIKSMIASHKGQGELNLKKILESKDMDKSSDILYSAVVLDVASKNKLFEMLGARIPQGWIPIGHHMTINLGPLKDKSPLGKQVALTVTDIGLSDMACAAKVSGYESVNPVPHITLGINPVGGKPAMSKEITKWQSVKPFVVMGLVTEISKYDKK